MSAGNKKDHKYFNCDEQYEIDYVKKQYKNPSAVEKWISEECKQGGRISNTTHDELYEMLDERFERKSS